MSSPHHFRIHVTEMAPAAVAAKDGWRQMDIRFLINRDNAGAEEACFWRTVFPPGAAHERHAHPRAAEILYVISGTGAAGNEDGEVEVSAGSAIYVPAGAVHWFRNLDEAEPVEVVGVYAPAGSLEDAGYDYVGEITEEHRQL